MGFQDSFLYLADKDVNNAEAINGILGIFNKYGIDNITNDLCSVSKVKLKKDFKINNESEYHDTEIDELKANDIIFYLAGDRTVTSSLADFFGDNIEYTIDELKIMSKFRVDCCAAFGLPRDLFDDNVMTESTDLS